MNCCSRILFILLFGTSCNDSTIKDASIKSGSLTSPASNEIETAVGNEEVPVKPGSNPPSDSIGSEIVDVELSPAVVPTVVAGAFLTCQPAAGQAQCQTRDKNTLVPIDVPDAKYYIIAEDLVWTPVEYQRIGVGTVTIQTNLEIYAIGLSASDGSLTGTWVKTPRISMLKNGSFEDFALLSPQTPYSPTAADPWQAIMSDGSDCEKPYIDFFRTSAEFPAKEGSVSIDLNAVCITGSKAYSEHIVAQNIPTVRGHLYQVFYSPGRNSKAALAQGLHTYWNLDIMDRLEMGATSVVMWYDRNFVGVATSSESRVGFSDPRMGVDGHGALLDNVRVYGLGAGPAK